MGSALGIDDLVRMEREIKKRIYYATSESVDVGSFMHVDKTEFAPEYFILNPKDLDGFMVLGRAFSMIEFVHIKLASRVGSHA